MSSIRPAISLPSALRSALFAVGLVGLFLLIAGAFGYGDVASTPFGLVLAVLLAYAGARAGRSFDRADP